MKVFISYSTREDQVVALRLQTLAVVSDPGLTIHVPPADTRHNVPGALSPHVVQQLSDSDVVLAVMLRNPVDSAVNEMNLAVQLGKLLIPLASPSVNPVYYERFLPYFVLNENEPWKTEQAIVNFLRANERTVNKPVVALLTLAVGLFLFSAFAGETK
jgi:hypothetical protein